MVSLLIWLVLGFLVAKRDSYCLRRFPVGEAAAEGSPSVSFPGFTTHLRA